MALTPEAIKKLMPDLEAWLSMKAAEALDESPEHEAAEEMPGATPEASSAAPAPPMDGEKKPGGLAVVIDMKPKGGPPGASGEKVPGCPDCADGTPHQHMGK